MKNLSDIDDNELRIVGGNFSSSAVNKPNPRGNRKKVTVIATVVVLVLVVAVAWGWWSVSHNAKPQDSEAVLYMSNAMVGTEGYDVATFDSSVDASRGASQEGLTLLGDTNPTVAYTEMLRDTVNDIPLEIYIPHMSTPSLAVGSIEQNDNVLFATQAADIRADNGAIVGAYVLKGEPLAWGMSKMGFCAIIDGKVTIGVQENSPLFEQAINSGGYFFRQYPLVGNGAVVMNNNRGKFIRKALCSRLEQIMVVMTSQEESMLDFSMALVDFGVTDAIYLVGADSHGFYRNSEGKYIEICKKGKRSPRYQNYIVWRR